MLINISDHSTRVHANDPVEGERTRVLGCLLGQQTGRVVDISNSLELKYEAQAHGVVIDEAFMAKKQEQCALGLPPCGQCHLCLAMTVLLTMGLKCLLCRQADLP